MLKIKSLRPQLMLIVAVALAPLAIASIVQGIMHVQARQHALDDVLHQTAKYATQNEQNTFSTTARFLELLAAQPELHTSPGACARALRLAAMGRVSALNVSLIDAKGKTVCSSTGKADVATYASLPWWPSVAGKNRAFVSQQMFSRAANRNVLPMVLPLRGASGAFDGALIADLDMRWVAQVSPFGRLPPFAAMLIVDSDGKIVAANRAVPRGFGKEVAKLGGDGRQHTFRGGADGARWRWTAAPIANSSKLIAFAITQPLAYGVTQAFLVGNILLPILMVILASMAMWLGTERLVIRWTDYLKRVSAVYKQNHYALELTELEEAPGEFRLLGDEMKSMAASIRERDRNLTAALDQKTAMAREIHHRIKNNLQIVASLISLYSQNVADREGRTAFTQILARVGALTLVSRLMEMRETQAVVDMRRLMTELGEQMRAMAAEEDIRFRLVMSVEDWLLPPDTATPVTFFLVEALAFVLFGPKRNGDICNAAVFFGADGPDRLLLWIEDGAFAPDILRMGRLAPDRVFAALAEQLKAEYRKETTSEGKSRVSLRLRIQPDMRQREAQAPNDTGASSDRVEPQAALRVPQDNEDQAPGWASRSMGMLTRILTPSGSHS